MGFGLTPWHVAIYLVNDWRQSIANTDQDESSGWMYWYPFIVEMQNEHESICDALNKVSYLQRVIVQ